MYFNLVLVVTESISRLCCR